MIQSRELHPDFGVQSMARLARDGTFRTETARGHDRPVLLWVTRGQGRVTVGDATRGYGAHNALFLPAGTPFGFTMMGQVLGTAVFFPERLAPDLPLDVLHIRLRDGYLQAEMTGLVDALEREATQRKAAYDRAMVHYGGLIGVWLERHSDIAERPVGNASAQRLASAYTAMVERDYGTGREVSDYAEALGVTAAQLSRICRERCGRSAGQMLAERIHGEAQRLLAEDRLPLDEIAQRLGFASAASFGEAFETHTGQSPATYQPGS